MHGHIKAAIREDEAAEGAVTLSMAVTVAVGLIWQLTLSMLDWANNMQVLWMMRQHRFLLFSCCFYSSNLDKFCLVHILENISLSFQYLKLTWWQLICTINSGQFVFQNKLDLKLKSIPVLQRVARKTPTHSLGCSGDGIFHYHITQ